MHSHDIIKNRILVIGANGLVGQRLITYYAAKANIELLACSIEDQPYFEKVPYVPCDITSREDVKKVIFDFYPDVIINASGFTNVDLSEKERERAWKINVKGVEYLAETCRTIDAKIIHFSTDYIFNGLNGPYDEGAKADPLGYYGRTKLASENALKISGVTYSVIRTNVLYGIANSRPDFVRWVINNLSENKRIRVVHDQINNPTYVEDLVQAINKIIELDKYGLYNIGGKDFLNRFEFAVMIAEYFGLNKELIVPIITEELKQPAKRPLKSGLITIKAETELGYKPHSILETLSVIKKQLSL
jgi:dTDP-4-dehydrorhamnose reductase